MSQYVVTIAIAAGVLVFIVYQQMRTRSIQSRQLIVIPVILALLGIANLQKHPPDSTAADLALGASVITAIVFGVGRGMTVQIWSASAVSMRQGTAATLALGDGTGASHRHWHCRRGDSVIWPTHGVTSP